MCIEALALLVTETEPGHTSFQQFVQVHPPPTFRGQSIYSWNRSGVIFEAIERLLYMSVVDKVVDEPTLKSSRARVDPLPTTYAQHFTQ